MLLDEFERILGASTAEYGLSVLKTNARAIGFYKKMGFEVKHQEGESLRLHKVLRT